MQKTFLLLFFLLSSHLFAKTKAPTPKNPYPAKMAAIAAFLEKEDSEDKEASFEQIEQVLKSSENQTSPLHTFKWKNQLHRHPKSIKVQPRKIKLPQVFHIHHSQHFSLQSPPWEELEGLEDTQLKELLHFLHKKKVKLRWKDQEDHIRTGKAKMHFMPSHQWEKTSALAPLLLQASMEKKDAFLERLLLLEPNRATFALKKESAILFSPSLVAKIIGKLLQQAEHREARFIASSITNLAQRCISFWSHKDPDCLTVVLSQLVMETTKWIQKEQHDFSIKEKGILLGGLLAAALLHAETIRSKDEKHLWLVNSISNLSWAASTFVGVIPLAGNVAAAVAGTISVSVVLWGVIKNKIGIRNLRPRVREIEGHIEFSLLEMAHANGALEKRVDILELLSWMRSTIHINGVDD